MAALKKRRRRVNLFWRVAYSYDNHSVPASKITDDLVEYQETDAYQLPIDYGLNDVGNVSLEDEVGRIGDVICISLSDGIAPWDIWSEWQL